MKVVIALFLLMVGSMALAAEPVVTCSARNLKLTYVPLSGFAGSSLTIEVKTGGRFYVINAAENEINAVENILGNQLTVQDPKGTIMDARTAYYTFVHPMINLPDSGAVRFSTMLVHTTAKTTIGGPSGVKGVVNDSTYTPVNCIAK